MFVALSLTKIIMKFILFIMIEISVYENGNAFAKNNRAFCRRVDETSVCFPWDSVVMAFRAIFGNSSIVTFTLML